jgi:prolyl-tRNA synthetase
MRVSQSYIKTLKETPNDAEITSHQLMLRAGMIRKLGSGLYTWLPLGLKVLRNVERIVREEMTRIHALEVLMPAVQPAELWQETGRWDTFGNQLLKMVDSNQREYCFGPTHEEVITDLIRHEIQSYKELPLTLYQIQTKFRDEIRPRFGVMRAREFIMKDAYSFHVSSESLQETYDLMYNAYSRIFDRMGLQYRAVEADTGAIGGAISHEFQVLADAGEDIIFYSDQGTYAANVEQATSLTPQPTLDTTNQAPTLVDTPGHETIEEVACFLNIATEQVLKTLVVAGTQDPWVAIVLRGNDTLNEIKAAKHPMVQSPLRLLSAEEIATIHNTPLGYIGPIGLNLPILVDHYAAALSSFVCGANRPGKHYQHANWLSSHPYETADLRNVNVGDPSPDGHGSLHMCHGIEVGHIFQLGDKYARAMHAAITDESGSQQTLIMGCYGLGISRIVAAAIEQHHDERGIKWPMALAPFQLLIIPINPQRSEAVRTHAEAIYKRCLELNIDVLFDDRNERPGVLFADADLLGIPHRFVISDRHLEQQQIEYKNRQLDSINSIALSDLDEWLLNTIVHAHTGSN